MVPGRCLHAYRKQIRGLELSRPDDGDLGMGPTGKGPGRIAWAMEMKVIYNDLLDVSKDVDYPATAVSKADLYAQCDILTVHVNHQLL